MLIYLLFCFCKVMINDLNLFVFSSRFKNQKESAEVNIVNWFSLLPSFGFPPFQLTFSSFSVLSVLFSCESCGSGGNNEVPMCLKSRLFLIK